MFVGLRPCIDSLATTCYPGSFAGIFLSPSCSLFFHGFLRKVIRNDKKTYEKNTGMARELLGAKLKSPELVETGESEIWNEYFSVLGRPRLQSI